MVGQIRKLVVAKGFGFISSEATNDFFFHRDDYVGSWDALARQHEKFPDSFIKVNFEPEMNGHKGPRARNVVMV